MATEATVLGIFDDGKPAANAAKALREAGLGQITAYSPVPDHNVEHAMHDSVSPVRTFVLVGGLVGCFLGFAFPIYTVLDWPMITGGKPLISIPAFVVIAFELTILIGAISGMLSFLGMAGLPRLTGQPAPDPSFTNDKFGLSVVCDAGQAAAVREQLEQYGATEVRE